MYSPQIKQLRARSKFEWSDHRSVTTHKRNYRSVDWIENIINSEFPAKSKSIDARIQKNLIKKQNLLAVMRCLITDALIYDKAQSLCKNHSIGNIVQMVKRNGVYVKDDRIPIIVKADVALIASRLDVSEPLIWKYLNGMERSGFTQQPPELNRRNP